MNLNRFQAKAEALRDAREDMALADREPLVNQFPPPCLGGKAHMSHMSCAAKQADQRANPGGTAETAVPPTCLRWNGYSMNLLRAIYASAKCWLLLACVLLAAAIGKFKGEYSEDE